MESLGQALKQKRAINALTQTRAAEMVGIEQSYLSKLESDQAWASLEVLERLCGIYRTDTASLLREVDSKSLRGNLHYQGFLQRHARRTRRWQAGLSAAALVLAGAGLVGIYLAALKPDAVHTPVSVKLVDVDGKDVLTMIAAYGGLTINGLDKVDGKVDYLESRDQPWDQTLAQVAGALGYRVEITGAKVDLIPLGESSGP